MKSNKKALSIFLDLIFLTTMVNAQSQEFCLPKKEIPNKSQPWRPVQDSVRDTVVQIFSQIAEFDWLQPYRTPMQYSVRGTGFLINDQGDIITNAHVVDQAIAICIQIPSMGKHLIDVNIVSICPERDLALLRITEDDLELLTQALGSIPYLPLGDSDAIHRADEVLALGYPLGQESLKSTTGVVSGRESNMIQISAPINHGNSGGPLLNLKGEVIGINSAGVSEAQNVGYAIPVNDLKVILNDLYKVKLLRKPFLGILSVNATESLTRYLGNPEPGGCYVIGVVKDSPLYKAGVEPGDMIYQINGLALDIYGEMTVPWSEDKVSLDDIVLRLSIGQDMYIKVYREGQELDLVVTFDHSEVLPIRKIYPGHEDIDYEVFAGMVVMQLTLNHINILANQAPGLIAYTEIKNQAEPVLLVTHIFPNSQLSRSRTLNAGILLNEINGKKVRTLDEFRKALKKSKETGFFTIKAVDNLARTSENILVVLPYDKIIKEETDMAYDFHYPLSDAIQELLKTEKLSEEK